MPMVPGGFVPEDSCRRIRAVAFRLDASRDATARGHVLICTTQSISPGCAVDPRLHFRPAQTRTRIPDLGPLERTFMLTSISTHFHQGGVGMWPILFTSVVTIAIIVERAIYLFRSSV